RTIAAIEYDLISRHPYRFTSDDVLFRVHAERHTIRKSEYTSEREKLVSKGRVCLRTSPLTKIYGVGIHADEEGKVALYGMETEEYQAFLEDDSVKKIKAMRNARL